MGLRWNGERIKAQLRAELRRRLALCARLVVAEARRLLGVDGWSGTRAMPSRPGDPPRRQAGDLRASVEMELLPSTTEGEGARVGTDDPVGLYQELGTRRIRPRPWLRPALRNCKGAILAILTRPMR